jgi:hypothetical protein
MKSLYVLDMLLFLDFSLNKMAQVPNRTYYDLWRDMFITELEQAGFTREQMQQLYDEVSKPIMRWWHQTLEQYLNLELNELNDVTVAEFHVKNVNSFLYSELRRLRREGYITERQLDQLYAFAPLPFEMERENHWWGQQPIYFNGHILHPYVPPQRARVPQARGIPTTGPNKNRTDSRRQT